MGCKSGHNAVGLGTFHCLARWDCRAGGETLPGNLLPPAPCLPFGAVKCALTTKEGLTPHGLLWQLLALGFLTVQGQWWWLISDMCNISNKTKLNTEESRKEKGHLCPVVPRDTIATDLDLSLLTWIGRVHSLNMQIKRECRSWRNIPEAAGSNSVQMYELSRESLRQGGVIYSTEDWHTIIIVRHVRSS